MKIICFGFFCVGFGNFGTVDRLVWLNFLAICEWLCQSITGSRETDLGWKKTAIVKASSYQSASASAMDDDSDRSGSGSG